MTEREREKGTNSLVNYVEDEGELWGGKFGDAYTERNYNLPDRRAFWRMILERTEARLILEPGANRGFNLQAIRSIDPSVTLWATDVNTKALRILRKAVPGVQALKADIRCLPFKDEWFDLTFTVGVLIHLKPEDVLKAIQELTRCSKRYILVCEYAHDSIQEISYRGMTGVLWRAPYGQIAEQSAALRRLDSGFLTTEQGFDRVTWWLYEKGRDSSG